MAEFSGPWLESVMDQGSECCNRDWTDASGLLRLVKGIEKLCEILKIIGGTISASLDDYDGHCCF